MIAGARSGKTSTLAHRVVHLAANGVDPRRILLITFSRRAAVEMTDGCSGSAMKRSGRTGRSKGSSRGSADWRAELGWHLPCHRRATAAGYALQAINLAGSPISFPLPLVDFAKAGEGPPTDPKLRP